MNARNLNIQPGSRADLAPPPVVPCGLCKGLQFTGGEYAALAFALRETTPPFSRRRKTPGCPLLFSPFGVMIVDKVCRHTA
ncbi:hypothetical protein [Methanogenium cariaci]|uniref:hypothetical protein n=1 Tax=Methanogenium cariaci TaxID=2197 RepID=UPI001FE0339B|nr:hypothetical protein [Methanogenium cariaci]